jgi:hypothetical protein
VSSASSLTERAIGELRKRFVGFGHSPSKAHWEGLAAIARTIEDMALGKAKAEYHYSYLPTGMGKTSVVLECIRQLLADPAYAQIGIVVFTHQLAHIKTMIKELALRADQYAVRTGTANKRLNEQGCGHYNKKGRWVSEHTEAQVLFATQAKLLAVAKYQHNAESFWRFRDQPRRVRIWDESILPAKPNAITMKQVEAAAVRLQRAGEAKAAQRLTDWVAEMQQLPVGASRAVEFPDFVWVLNGDWNELVSDPTADTLEDPLMAALGEQSGKVVRIVADGYCGATSLHYHEILPKNLAPMLILDASGALRVTYEKWKAGRGNLTELPSPGKTYRNLTIRHWEHPAGKAAYRDPEKLASLAEAVLVALREVPAGEQLLVIHHLPEKPSTDLALKVSGKLKAAGLAAELEAGGVQFLTWGKHMASNQFADCKNVMIVGLLQYNWPMNEAYLRAAGKLDAEEDAGLREVDQLRIGEVAHHLFQAVGRGAVRKTVGGDVPPGCRLWCIFSGVGRMRVPRLLLGMVFPGATVEAWEPCGVRLRDSRHHTDNREKLVAELVRRLARRGEVVFELGDLATFNPETARRLLADERVGAALAARGLELVKGSRKAGRVRRVTYTLRRSTRSMSNTYERLWSVGKRAGIREGEAGAGVPEYQLVGSKRPAKDDPTPTPPLGGVL